MKIQKIDFNNTNKVNRINPAAQNYRNYYVTKPLQPDSVSFGRVAENAEKMRNLFKYGMIDIYTGKEIIDPEWFQLLLQKDIFNHSIQTVVKTLKPIEGCLHKVEGELFKKIEEMSQTNPLYRLDDVIQKLAPKAQEQLLKMQRPIFEKLKKLSIQLPAEQKQAFDELMSTTEKQLENKPILYKFSKKEFKYQLERIAQDIKLRGFEEEINAVEKLINMSEKLPYTPSGRNFSRRNAAGV